MLRPSVVDVVASVRAAVAIVAISTAACSDAIVVAIGGDRPVPQGVDAICVGIADTAEGGGQFGKLYRLEDKLAGLPQTLRLEPGSASTADVWVRGDRGGVPVVRAGVRTDFTRDVTFSLDRCNQGSSRAPALVGGNIGPASARLALSQGPGGQLVVAVASGSAAMIDAVDGALVTLPAPAPPAGAIAAVVPIDVDGDCDDDLLIATDGAAPAIWRRTQAGFEVAGALTGAAGAAAVAVADVDRDGDIDIITGAGAALTLWRNDGGGTFTVDNTGALSSDGIATAIRSIAVGDLDGDGNPDLVVGQSTNPILAWLGDPNGSGAFRASNGVIAGTPLDVARLWLVDADADFDPDLAVALVGKPMRLYIDRDGLLEDQTFVRLPQAPSLTGAAIAIGGWDDGCEPDAVTASTAGGTTLRGKPGGALEVEAPAPAASDVILVDIDDDGDLDAVLATPEGVRWLAR